MKRRIIHIDEEKCNGCGACAAACHEGAIAMVDGKARLIRDDYCDGLGDCLPACPAGAITFVEREAAAYDAEAVKENMMKKRGGGHQGCPGSRLMTINRDESAASPSQPTEMQSRLRQWPVQIKLVPVNAPYFDGAKLLIAADCTRFCAWKKTRPGTVCGLCGAKTSSAAWATGRDCGLCPKPNILRGAKSPASST